MITSATRRFCYVSAIVLCLIILYDSTSVSQYRPRHSNTEPVLEVSIHDITSNGVALADETALVHGTIPSDETELQSESRPVEEPVLEPPSHDYSRFENSSSKRPSPKSVEAHDFWRSFTDLLAREKPSFEEVRRKSDDGAWLFFNDNHSAEERPDNTNMSENEVDELRRLRNSAIEGIKTLSENLPYVPGTRGIVTTAPQNAFAILTTSLWMLRQTGSSLPVEIWLYNRTESEPEPCNVIFPSLGATCMFMVDYLPEVLEHPLDIVKFTYKPLATLFSTFEEFIFLDDDVFPVLQPDVLFETEPFLSSGMVTFPDFWADTASAELYKISGLDVPDLRQRASTESGEFAVRKSTHSAALLLATWFNTYGPNHWHRLATQGSPGEGDKDLWRFAIQAFDLPWYQVEQEIERIGYSCGDDSWPIGSAHAHPVDDYKLLNGSTADDGTTLHPRILFVHCNLPKLDPYLLLDWPRITPGWTHALRCDNGTGPVHRLYGPPELTIQKFGYDFEKSIWNAFAWMACQHEKAFVVWTAESWFRPNPRHDICEAVQALWDEHFPGERWSREPPAFSIRGRA